LQTRLLAERNLVPIVFVSAHDEQKARDQPLHGALSLSWASPSRQSFAGCN
jgi:hypothetical protein